MAALASDWLRHFRLLLWNRWTEFNKTWQEVRSQSPLLSLCFSGWSEKQDGRPGLWLAETFSTSPLRPLHRIQRNLIGSKISRSSTKILLFGSIGKTRWPPWPLIGWDIFDFSSETIKQNSTKLDRKQDLNVLYQVCVFRADQKIKMAALASDWLRHFRLLLWNRWMEFNETWQEARSQCPLPSLCFSGRSEKQHGRPGLWMAKTFSTSPLKPLIWIERNLIGSKISMSSTKFVFFGPIRKQKWPPWLILQKGGTLYSGARYVAVWASCFLSFWRVFVGESKLLRYKHEFILCVFVVLVFYCSYYWNVDIQIQFFLQIVCERSDVLASACAIARILPRYSAKSNQSDTTHTVTVEFVLVGHDKNMALTKDDLESLSVMASGIRTSAAIVDMPCSEMHTDRFLEVLFLMALIDTKKLIWLLVRDKLSYKCNYMKCIE